jgi:hypothetical protein
VKILLKSKKKNYFATICIGKKHFQLWKKNILPSWKIYCKNNDIGIIFFEKHLISKKNIYWKKPTWQKYLIGDKLKDKDIKNICYLDTDILINPLSPNIFAKYNPKKILVSSNIFNLPYDLKSIQKKVVFYRKTYLNKKYPLDSAIFANLKQTYDYSNLKPQKDSLCAGLFIFNNKNHGKFFKDFFFKFQNNCKSLTGGDQTHFSYYVLKYQNIELLEYKFQAFWIYEMARNYPFLYYTKNKKIINQCIEACLMNNYFIHFAGKWLEGRMWKINNFKNINLNFYRKLNIFYKKKVYGNPVGIITDK